MKSKTFTFTAVALTVIIILGIALFQSIRLNQKLRKALPYLTEGETGQYFDLTDMEGKDIDLAALEEDRLSLIYVFSRPCSPCDKNIVYWKKIAEVLGKDHVNVYGIVLDSLTEAYNFAREARLNFKIYAPRNLEKFIEAWRVKSNHSQTILYQDRVRWLKLGEMSGEEAIKAINLGKRLTANLKQSVKEAT